MGRGDLTDEQWATLEPLLPKGAKAGRPPVWPRRQLIDGVRFRVRTGVPWRDVPVEYGPWGRVYDLFRRWQRDGTWHRILTRLQSLSEAKGAITWDLSVDSTVCRAHQHAAGARKQGELQKEPPGGVGPDSAAALLVSAGDNPERLVSEASFAALCGTSPVEASSGKTQRRRLNRGGDRQANAATTTSSVHAMSATTPPFDSSAIASSASSTAASRPAPVTTKRPHGRTTHTSMPLDLKRHGVSQTLRRTRDLPTSRPIEASG